MTVLLVIVGSLLVGATAWLGVRVVTMPRQRIELRLRQIGGYGFDTHGAQLELVGEAGGWLTSSFNAFAGRIGAVLMRRVPRLTPLARHDLTAAGYYGTTPEAIHGYRAMIAVFLPALVVLYASGTGGLSLLGFALTAGAAALGWELPALVIRRRGASRLDQIDRELPQFIDLLVATVEAGIGFGGALDSVGNRFNGPLGDELRLTTRQQRLGLGTERALADMAERCPTASLRAFVRAAARAESHGVSVGPVMRHLASDIRIRRRDVAREKIQKAPIKLLFPLVLLILPALLMVILFPALYNIIHVLKAT
jgi:tight adherence protein C